MLPLEIPRRRRLLLTAACHVDGERAADAWRRLVEDCGSEESLVSWVKEGSEQRILPLLHERLAVLAVSASTAEVITDSVVESWALNERLLMTVRPMLERLLREGVEIVCIKGLALLGDVYPAHRLRPIGDVDALVRPSQCRLAFRLLRESGWVPPIGSRVALPGMAAINVSLGAGASIDLHQRPARDLPHRAGRDPFCWDAALPLAPAHPLADLALRRPSTADHVVILAAHIMRATNSHLTHPLADFHRLLEAARAGRTQPLDVGHLVSSCRDQRASLRVAAVLRETGALTGLEVPAALSDLEMEAPRRQRLERRVVESDARGTSDATGPLATLGHAWFGVRAATTGEGLVSKTQVFAAAMTAWADLRLGRGQRRRRIRRSIRRRESRARVGR